MCERYASAKPQKYGKDKLTHVDSLRNRNCRTRQRDDNGSSSRRRLQQNGSEDTNHDPGNRVGFVSKQFSSGTSRHDLGSVSEQVKSKEEEVEKEDHTADTTDDPGPLLSGVHAAGVADLSPSGISDVFLGRVGGKVGVAEMERVGGTILARGVRLFWFSFSRVRLQ